MSSSASSAVDDDEKAAEEAAVKQRCRTEIVALLRVRRSVAAPLAAARTRAERKALAEKLRAIGGRIEERELRMESMRVSDAMRGYEKDHPSVPEECPVCLEELALGRMSRMACCGNSLCVECADPDVHSLGKCPLCRGDVPSTEREQFRIIKEHAEAGRSWGQLLLADCYEYGKCCVPLDFKEAIKWYQLAAEQENAEASYRLGNIYMKTSSISKALYFLKRSLDLGFREAFGAIGKITFNGLGGRTDHREAAKYFTLAVAHDPDDACSSLGLGSLFLSGGSVDMSIERAKHYLERAAKSLSEAFHPLGVALMNLEGEQYCGNSCLVGHDSAPRALFYMRKAITIAEEESGGLQVQQLPADVEELLRQRQSACNNCHEKSGCPEKLKRCTKCRAAWYCGKSCQRQHWKDGHKVDCIEAS